MSSPCGDICKCIKAAERSVHDEGLLVVQEPSGVLRAVTGYTNATGVLAHANAPERRGLFLLGFLIIAVIEAFTLTTNALLVLADQIVINSVDQARYMDFKYWTDGDPPACSVYMFWSHSCGAILSHSARTCSDGGTRLYKNSCLGIVARFALPL